MAAFLTIAGALSVFLGIGIAFSAKTAFHEIIAAICVTGGFLMFGLAALRYAIEPIRFVAERMMLRMQDEDRRAEAARKEERKAKLQEDRKALMTQAKGWFGR